LDTSQQPYCQRGGGAGASGAAAPDGRVQGAPKWAALMFKNETIKDIFTLLFLN